MNLYLFARVNSGSALFLSLALSLVAACGSPNDAANNNESSNGDSIVLGTNPQLNDFGADASQVKSQAAAGARLNYYKGPVLSSAKVVKVLYGSGSYQSFVTATGSDSVAGFFTAILKSAYVAWLNEYNPPGSKITIGSGSYAGSYSIAPSAARNSFVISDAQVQQELAAQIASRTLPSPDSNTLYFVYFPRGKLITAGGALSCRAGGFCAYHGTFSRNGSAVSYVVMPDNSVGSGCDLGCGGSTAFGNNTSVASHELVESITDPSVGLATTYGPPLSWYDPANGEIGDICNGQQATVSASGYSYTVQKEWSNRRNACVSQ